MTEDPRQFPASFDPGVIAQIDARLAAVEAGHAVCIPHAIESGSRAWGFPSPDSDYDCRFVYVRRAEDYLTLWPPRDVIETPLDAVLDVNGWDVGKLLALIVKGNAVAVEWLQSPIRYRDHTDFRAPLLAFAREWHDPDAIARHYFHLGSSQWRRHRDSAIAKKLFYALRPALALRWMRLHGRSTLPPMHVGALLEAADLDPQTLAEIERLIVRKAGIVESGETGTPAAIGRLIDDEFDRAAALPDPETRRRDAARAAAAALFRTLIAQFAPE